jgi:hypothetical protein
MVVTQNGVHVSGLKVTVTWGGNPFAVSETGKEMLPWCVRLKF